MFRKLDLFPFSGEVVGDAYFVVSARKSEPTLIVVSSF
jgi:hypothetical protein